MRSSWLVLAGVALAGLGVAATFRYPLVTDDPFITYRYAHNLSTGQGFVYNTGQRVLSTTTPLYALVLGGIGLIWSDIPSAGFWLSVAGLVACAFFAFLILSSLRMEAAGLIAAFTILVSEGLVLTLGLETGFYLALALAGVYSYFRQKTTAAFVLFALTTLTRNDGVLLALLAGCHLLLKELKAYSRPERWLRLLVELNVRPLLAFVMALTPWLIFAWLWFGTPFPFTLTAKIAQAQSGLWDSFAIGLFKWAVTWIGRDPLLLALAFIGAAYSVRQWSPLLLIGAWSVAHLVAYSLLGVAFYAWYVAPLLVAVAVFAGVGAEQTARWVGGKLTLPQVFVPISALLGILLITLQLRTDMASGMQQPSAKVQVYRQAGEWIALNTAPEATVDTLEVGIIGYYDNRRTLDFVGLVDPERVPYLRLREFAQGVRLAAADYVLALPTDTWLPGDTWFSNAYERVQQFRGAGFYSGQPLVVYRRADYGRAVSRTIQENVTMENNVQLLSVDLFASSVGPGETLPIALHLRAGPGQGVENKITLQLVANGNRVIAQTDTPYPKRLTEDGQPFVDHQGIQVSSNASPGVYDLMLAFYNAENGERSNVVDANGHVVGDVIRVSTIEIR